MKKYIVGIIYFFLTVLVLFGCSNASGKEEAVQVNIALNGKMSPLLIGKEKGLFEEEFAKYGAEISWSEFPSGPPLLESLASNRVDLSYLGDGALIAGLDKNLPFEVIAQTGRGAALSRVIAQSGSGIDSIEDLKGKTVGMPAGTTAHVYLLKALKFHGLNSEDIKIINLQPDDAQAAFESGQLDAWSAWEPYVTNNVAKGTAKIIEVDGEILAPGGVIARTGFAEEHPELVEAFLRIYNDIIEWQIANPDEASEIYAKETKMDFDTVKALITAEDPDLRFTDESIEAQQDTIDTLAEIGYIQEKFSFEERINKKYLDAIFNSNK